MKVGLTVAQLSTIFSTRPSTADAKPQASWAESRTLPNEWAIGSHRNCRSLSSRMFCDADRLALVDPRLVAQPHALGAAGGAGGVDQGGELLGRDRGGLVGDDAGVLGQVGGTELGQLVQGDDPVAVGRAVEGDDLGQVRQLVLALAQLGDLLVVLGEDEAGLGVAEDVRRVLGVGARVDRGRGARGAHHREVGQDPLVARAGHDADPLLRLEAEREQSRREGLDPVTGLLPGDGLPRVALRVAEGLARGGLGDAVQEQDRHVRLEVVDEARVVLDRHGTPCAESGGGDVLGE